MWMLCFYSSFLTLDTWLKSSLFIYFLYNYVSHNYFKWQPILPAMRQTANFEINTLNHITGVNNVLVTYKIGGGIET